MKIGNIETKSDVFLAPMAGWTDYPYRVLCSKYGAGLVVTEMVSALGLHYNSKNTEQLLLTSPQEHPVAIQLFGSNPQVMAEACKNHKLQNFDIIDINMGCPVPKVVKNGEGSALMNNLPLASQIISECKKATKKPVTVKFRLGFENRNHNVMEFAKMCQDAGADAVTIHGRTRAQFYAGSAVLDEIFEVAEVLDIPVIANGDIKSKEEYNKIKTQSKCAGISIGRASIGHPEIFSEILGLPHTHTKKEIILMHKDLLTQNYTLHYALTALKKNLVFYIANIPNATQYRTRIFQANSIDEIINITFEALNIEN